ncbi:MAG TPA: AAA family ATPase [Acidimicrobiia bacterium]|nr:AAA family ATPase [Acidimicrobiia bacterium]
MQRVAVVGSPGSGKTTFATALARRLDVLHVELDAIFHQPGWTPLPEPEFRRQVGARAAEAGWVFDGNYAAVRDLVWERADTIIWLDLRRSVVMPRVVRRTIRRTITREELWNGNREPWSNLWSLDRERSIIAWSWKEHPRYRASYAAAMADPAHAHLEFVRLGSPRSARRFLAAGDRAGWTRPPDSCRDTWNFGDPLTPGSTP